MKKLLLSTSLVLFGSAAFAADLPMQTKAPMLPPAVFSWTGCYLGAHVGGGTSNSSSNLEGFGQGLNGTGAIVGGQAGCNYQDGNWVIGIEGEGAWSGIKANNNTSTTETETPAALRNNLVGAPPSYTEVFNQSSKNTSNFDIAARAGIAFDRTLIYGKGGWAWGKFAFSTLDICCGPESTPYTTSWGSTLNGFLVGVGVEHALTRNWTVKLEYNYIGYGSKQMSATECGGGSCSVYGSLSNSANVQLFKVGANYLFNAGH
jgi:outer membrane immunogenic protein